MTGTLRVTPRELINASQDFEKASRDVQRLTDQMLKIIQKTCRSSWRGDASSTFLRKFNNLSGDMQQMYRKIYEHSTDLTEMAKNYTGAEDTNITAYGSLQEDVIS